MTIEEREAIVNRFFEAGADDYSVKPIKALDLVARINTHLRYREQLYADGSKNITPHTLRMIEDCLRSFNDLWISKPWAQIWISAAKRFIATCSICCAVAWWWPTAVMARLVGQDLL